MRIGGERADELLVDLEHVERQARDRSEVRMAGPKVVDRETHAAIAQRPHDARNAVGIGYSGRLSDLELQQLRIKA